MTVRGRERRAGWLRVLILGGAVLCIAPGMSTEAQSTETQSAGAQSTEAASPEAAERSLSLTVYNQDLGVVRETRELRIPGGTGWVRFRDVPARIDPTSVHLRPADDRALTVLEQNYEYDLVSSEKILERYLDSPIQVILEEGRLYEGTLLSARGGSLVLGETSAGEGVVILSREKVTDIQFPALPQGLITRPTLAWLLSAPSGDPRRSVEVSYMTSGMNWHAEYVAIIAPDDRSLDLGGWVSVENQSGATYPDAQLQLVAGDVRRVRDAPVRGMGRAMALEAQAAAPGFEEERFFEYHLYSLGRRTTLHDNETKQISLFDPTVTSVTKLFECNPRRDGQKVRVVLETENREATGLGLPLPAGKVRAYKRDAGGQLQFVGEDRIDHTPRGEKVRVTVGKAFDLVVERTELATRKPGPRTREVDVEIELRNRKEDETVTIVLQEDLQGYWEIRQSSHEFERTSATRIEFSVTVRPGETRTVTYTVRYNW
ncbi:MAG: DUF4139 domain-containing protein [Candidatus Eisenbacteria bacterium]|nr:DUF4139 domain-containing protein [Candidatus Eisenbacteria bacterium]